MGDSEIIKDKTKKLIAKIKLKPLKAESLYSQSFIDRERDIASRIRTLSEEKINAHTTAYALKERNF